MIDNLNVDEPSWDVFISYASEDLHSVANPLANALKSIGLKVWYDKFEIRPGDSLFGAIDEGIRSSRYGIVILSPDFFAKGWTKHELSALFSISTLEKKKVIIPIWHKMSAVDIGRISPLMSNIVAIKWEQGLDIVIREIVSVISPENKNDVVPLPLIIAAEVRKALSRNRYSQIIESLIKDNGMENVFSSLRYIVLDIDQIVWIRIRAFELLITLGSNKDILEHDQWIEFLQQPIPELIEGAVRILIGSNVILPQPAIEALLNNHCIPRNSVEGAAQLIYSFIEKGAEYSSSTLLPLATSRYWEVKYGCVKVIIKLDDNESIQTLNYFASMSYEPARRRILQYIHEKAIGNQLTDDERNVSIHIVNQIINDGKTNRESRNMRRAIRAMSMLSGKKGEL